MKTAAPVNRHVLPLSVQAVVARMRTGSQVDGAGEFGSSWDSTWSAVESYANFAEDW